MRKPALTHALTECRSVQADQCFKCLHGAFVDLKPSLGQTLMAQWVDNIDETADRKVDYDVITKTYPSQDNDPVVSVLHLKDTDFFPNGAVLGLLIDAQLQSSIDNKENTMKVFHTRRI